MQLFYSILIDHFLLISKQKHFSMDELNILCKPIFELTQQLSDFAFTLIKEKLKSIQQQLIDNLMLHSTKITSYYPSISVILFLKLISNLFPVSDYQHPIIIPTLLLLNQFISQCPILSCHDIAKGLFISNLIFKFVQQSQRYCPEVIHFLNNVSDYYKNNDSLVVTSSINYVKIDTIPISYLHSSYEVNDQFKLNLFYLWIKTTNNYLNIYSSKSYSTDIFTTLNQSLSKINLSQYPQEIKVYLK